VLVTGFDIIFFWVARMMMMGLHFMGQAPFHTVYIHALVRDEKGQKMSKSKGNVMDPLNLIHKFGADALRFTLTAFAAQGRDVKMSEQRVEGYRNFCTKLWNAARFCQMNECAPVPGFDPATCKLTLNKWIIGKLTQAAADTARAIETYRFNEAASVLYQFTWGTFCDWHLEFAKPVFQSADDAAKAETRAATAWVLDRLLSLLHPVMPFITEELWAEMAERRDGPLITSSWPVADAALMDANAAAEMDWVVRLITAVRAVRAELNVPAKARIPLLFKGLGEAGRARLAAHRELILTLARLSDAGETDDAPQGAVQDVLDEATLILPLADVIDLPAEKARLEKEIAKLDADIAKHDKKLANTGFTDKAPPEVVETERDRRAEAAQTKDKLAEALGRLSGL